MRTTQYLLTTQKETPADAEVISHQLMLRAGMIRKLASGLYNWLPLGLKVLRKVERIVRNEMEKAGALELLMTAVQPAELWQESGRWEHYGPELLRIVDRHKRSFCFGPTHEEVITEIARKELKSYKQLPLNFYQIQSKFRDEIRPRFGVMRAREFLMKDAYSFHETEACLKATYQRMYQAYCNIFERIGLEYRAVLADTGSIGGETSHEFHVLAGSGEDAIVFSDESDYAANIEMAEAPTLEHSTNTPSLNLEKVSTPNVKSIEEVCAFFECTADRVLKTLIVAGAECPLVALVIRGDHELNAVKAAKHTLVASPLRFASNEEIEQICGCSAGSIGPKELPIPLIVDKSAAVAYDFICGANQNDAHYQGANWGRDFPAPENLFDLRNIQEGEICPDGKGVAQIKRGIEVGHIFQLGTKYSEALKATVLNESGKSIPMIMGCYGIGVSRIVAAAIEQNHDERGIIWPDAIAPFQVSIIPMNYHKSHRVREVADRLYTELLEGGCDVLLDDRKERAGVLFADTDLMGLPHHIIIGERGIDQGILEYQTRAAGNKKEIPIEQIVTFIKEKLLGQDLS